jgi:hypothetical protein
MKNPDDTISIASDEEETPIMMKMPGELIFTKNGKWKHDGVLVQHSGVARYFSRHLKYSPSHKSWVVEVDGKCVPAVVEDTPQVVTSIDLSSHNTTLTLSNGLVIPLDLSDIHLSREGVWYASAGDEDRFRILRNVVQSLMPYIEELDDKYVMKLHGKVFEISSDES